MKTKSLLLLFMVFGIMGAENLNAQTFTDGILNYSVNADGNTVTCTGYAGSTAINDLVIPSSVTNNGYSYSVSSIGNAAFFMNNNLHGSLTISSRILTIGNTAFYGCHGLDGTLTIGSSVTRIGNMAFENCDNLTGDLVIPNSVTEVGYRAFNLCNGLNGTLTLSNSLTVIEDYAFAFPFTGDLVIPNTVVEIRSYSFASCKCNSVRISTNVIAIGQNAFEYNDVIEKVVIPNSVTDMGRMMFRGCSSLDTLVIGRSVVNVSDRLLVETRLRNVTCLAANPPVMDELIKEHIINSLIVPCGSLEAYESSNWNTYFATIIENCGHDAVAELSENEAKVYPNPTNGVVRIEALSIESVSVYNSVGEMLFSSPMAGNAFEFDFSAYGNGVYVISIETAEGIVTKKVLVK